MVAFFIGAILYFVGYAVQTFRNDITTVTVYETGVEDSMDTTGLVVRQETLLEGSGERMEVLPAEGESVAKGEVIARIYKDQAALEQHQTLKAKQTEREALQYVLSHSTESSDTAELSKRVIASLESIRSTVFHEDLSDLSDQIQSVKNMIYRQDYTYKGSETVTKEINQLSKEIKKLEKEAGSTVSTIKAEQAEREKAIDAQRLEGALSLAGGMADAMKQVYESGLAQSKGVYQLYQALAIAEATISTYKAAQAAYAQGMEWGGPVVGAIMAATAVAAGMARVAAIKSTPLKGFAFGGLIGGQDKGERADNVLIRATPGEYMLDRPTVRHYGVSALEALRRRSVPRELLEPFASPRLPASGGKRTAYALGGEIGNGSLTEGGKASGNEGLTVINVMDFQREFDRALASTRGRRVLINILGEEGIAS